MDSRKEAEGAHFNTLMDPPIVEGIPTRPPRAIKPNIVTADQLLADAARQSRELGLSTDSVTEDSRVVPTVFSVQSAPVTETVVTSATRAEPLYPRLPAFQAPPVTETVVTSLSREEPIPSRLPAYKPQESIEEWHVLDPAEATHTHIRVGHEDLDNISMQSSQSTSHSDVSQSHDDHHHHHGKLHRLKEKLMPHKKDHDELDVEKRSTSKSPSVLKKIAKKIDKHLHRNSHHDHDDDTESLPADFDTTPVSSAATTTASVTSAPEQISKDDERFDVASLNLRPAPQGTAASEQPFLAAPGDQNPRFRRGQALVATTPDAPPSVEYSETVSIGQGGKVVPLPVGDPQLELRIKEDGRRKDFLESAWANFSPLLIMGGIAVAVLAVPMPSFMKGFLFGCILMGTAGIRIWFTVLYPRKNPRVAHLGSGGAALVPGDPSKRFVSLDKDKKAEPPSAWMNQMLGDFHFETFHVNQTASVYVTLDGSSVRVRRPKERVVARRAMFDEELKSATFTFTENRVYNIEGADVFFVPEDIPRKRRWIWRFPIGIRLKDPESLRILVEEAREFERKKAEEDAKRGIDKEEVQENVAPARTTGEKDYDTLYLMPRCNREKEDWLWRFKAAAGQARFPIERPYISPELSTLNAFVHRICFDVLTESTWATIIAKKIQKKLSVIALPFFIEELQLLDIDLGQGLPTIGNVSAKPGVDERGLWAEMDFEYNGTVQMTLSTKLNLMKLKEKASEDSIGPHRPQHTEHGQSDREANFDVSDEEEEFDENAAMAPKGENSKLMRYVERIQHSKAFQKLTNIGVVKRAMENVSDTELMMTVVIQRLAGRLAINLPHPPSDKLWWAFVDKPELQLKAFPKMGEKEVTMDRVIDWIESRMMQEIYRMITVPNMDDISIPIMNSTLDDPELRMGKLTDLILK